ncbi:hypothetical protein, partial [Rhodoplanes roseus]|uniref:hypothetical protein n=1 Tax=Rhodoplanes roseus TaxID=29409 RepID=UPI003CCAF9DC
GSRPGEPGAAGSDRPGPDDGGTERGRVIPFAPRRPAAGPHRPSQSPPPASDRRVADLARYETGEEPDDYRHRMITNVAALLVLAALTAGGLWIASTMADMRKNQDCVLSGRRGCTPVPVPAESPRP